MKVLLGLLALLIFGINLLACHSGEDTSTASRYNTSQKGVIKAMRTYHMGWFVLEYFKPMYR